MSQNHNIGIIGLGWLGLPLAKRLHALGYNVFGTTTSEEKLSQLKSNEVKACLWNEGKNLPYWLNSLQTIIVTIPPNKTEHYCLLLEQICTDLNRDCHVIFTSSTGIYSDRNEITTEQGIINKENTLYYAEETIKNQLNFTVLRLAGLIGNKRHPIHFLAGREVKNGNWPVNLLTLEDALNAIEKVASVPGTNQVYNVCNPEHPSKSNYYTFFAEKLNLPNPIFTSGKSNGKSIDSSLFEKTFEFCYNSSIYEIKN